MCLLQVCREEVLGGPGGLPYTLFGLFDGHGGSGTSLKLAMELPLVIHQNLLELLPLLTDRWAAVQSGQEEDTLSQVMLIIWNLAEPCSAGLPGLRRTVADRLRAKSGRAGEVTHYCTIALYRPGDRCAGGRLLGDGLGGAERQEAVPHHRRQHRTGTAQ